MAYKINVIINENDKYLPVCGTSESVNLYYVGFYSPLREIWGTMYN